MTNGEDAFNLAELRRAGSGDGEHAYKRVLALQDSKDIPNGFLEAKAYSEMAKRSSKTMSIQGGSAKKSMPGSAKNPTKNNVVTVKDNIQDNIDKEDTPSEASSMPLSSPQESVPTPSDRD